MKIALVDNMNNNFFATARYFRDLGVEADLFLIPGRNHTHFEPQADTWQDLSSIKWLMEFPISYHPYSFLRPIRNTLVGTFSKYDKIIACGSSLGLFRRAGLVVDLFVPYGSDLINSPFPCHESPSRAKAVIRFPLEEYRARLQRLGIQQSVKIILNSNWAAAMQALIKLNCTAVNLPRIMVYKESPPEVIFQKYSWLLKYDFIVFSPTRHLWATNAEPMFDFKINGGAKRNDKLIRAFAKLVKTCVIRHPLLLLSEYGADVEHSKRLIADLEVGQFVKWLPILPRKELLVIMRLVSVVADQFRVGMSATSAGTSNEALAAGRPIITNTDGATKDISDPYYSSPILQALDEDEIFFWLKKCAESPDFIKSVGGAGERWFDEELGLGLARKYLDLLG